MCEIIAFQPNAKLSRRAAAAEDGAQILFFLGVRYLRMEEPPAAASPGKRGGEPAGGKKRKRRARA
jgi:hypothetical protein